MLNVEMHIRNAQNSAFFLKTVRNIKSSSNQQQ